MQMNEAALELAATVYPKIVRTVKELRDYAKNLCELHGLPFTEEGVKSLAARQQIIKGFFKLFPCEVKDERVLVAIRGGSK